MKQTNLWKKYKTKTVFSILKRDENMPTVTFEDILPFAQPFKKLCTVVLFYALNELRYLNQL